MSLKQKTISGLTWSFIDVFAKQGIVFIIGIILARLLTPRDFGLIGMTTIFIFFSDAFIDSGFGQALVRKQNCTQADYSTVFFYNLFVGLFLFLLLFFSAGAIANFFNEPKLKLIIQVLSAGIIVRSFTIIHEKILIKRIDFKLKTKISIFASIISGGIGITMAFIGFGVWSLVAKTLSAFIISSILLWIWNKWVPSLVFSYNSFKELFAFGSRLLVSSIIRRVYENIFIVVIGKYFSAADLGFYTRANQFKNLASNTLTGVIQRVSYPSLATIQDDKIRLKTAYEKLIKSTMLITFFLMIGLVVMAKPLVITLIGEKWMPSVILLQLLCFVGIFHPLQEINLNMLKVLGRSDIILKLEIAKKILVIPVIFIGLIFGIKILIVGMVCVSFISFLIDSFFAGKRIGYSTFDQISGIFPSFIIAVTSGAITYSLVFINNQVHYLFIIQVLVYLFVFILICEFTKIPDYVFLKNIIVEKYSQIRKK
ncbi:MAG: lipopolysaccharide biosynthesis protein [bacterium]